MAVLNEKPKNDLKEAETVTDHKTDLDSDSRIGNKTHECEKSNDSNAASTLTQKELLEWLHPVEDPELFLSLVDLGLIYEAQPLSDKSDHVHVKMTLTSPGCPAGDYLVTEVKKRLLEHENIQDASVEIVWEPKWDPAEMASDEVKDRLGIW